MRNKKRLKTGMYVHGLNLNDPEHDAIVFGKPPFLLGRATMAAYLLMTEYPHCEYVLFGSGASEKDGLKEGQHILKTLFERWDALNQFEVFEGQSYLRMLALKRRLRRIAEPEIESKNTFTELAIGIPKLYQWGCRRIVHVTEPTHNSRAHAHGHEILQKHDLHGKVMLVAEDSMVVPEKVKPDQVVVFEPRADGQNEIVPNLRRIFRLQADKRAEFNQKFDTLLTETGV